MTDQEIKALAIVLILVGCVVLLPIIMGNIGTGSGIYWDGGPGDVG